MLCKTVSYFFPVRANEPNHKAHHDQAGANNKRPEDAGAHALVVLVQVGRKTAQSRRARALGAARVVCAEPGAVGLGVARNDRVGKPRKIRSLNGVFCGKLGPPVVE